MPVKKIAILGGGPAALSTAFQLTSQSGWQERYSVTLYQVGWRLGGKCATGRSARDHRRIQEHGIHLAGNFYTNLFHTVRDAYNELYGVDGSKNRDDAIRSLDSALVPNSYSLATEYRDGKWHLHDMHLPHNDEKPWDVDWRPNVGALAQEVVGFVASFLHRWSLGKPSPVGTHHPRHWRAMIAEPLVKMGLHAGASRADELVTHAENAPDDPSAAVKIVELLDDLLGAGWKVVGDAAAPSDELEWVWMLIDFYAGLLRGVIADELFEKGVGRIDHLSHRTWLRMHGVAERTLDSPIAQTTCNICFQYEDGDTTRLPNMSAAAYVMFTVRLVLSPGAPMWFFRAGTGDTIIAPLYRVLRDRGVRFAFFHKVKDLELASDGTSLASVVCERQARPKGGDFAYDPLEELDFDVEGGNEKLPCWPGEPLFDRLENGDELRTFLEGRDDLTDGPAPDPPRDLESYWCPKPPGAEVVKLAWGEDFDYVVLGLSIAAIPIVAPALVETHAALWKPALHHGRTIATQQIQCWFDEDLSEMGWNPDRTGGGANRLVGPTYNQPMPDLCDFSDLIGWEKWPAPRPKSLLYFCGPMQDPSSVPSFEDTSYPRLAYQRIGWEGASYLRTAMGPVFPAGTANPGDAQGLDFGLLHSPGGGATGVNRIWSQYLRANIDPTERYVLSLPGSLEHRLKAWTSGLSNLYLTGDWIDNGLNVGSFEAAIMSGMLASYALTGSPRLEDIAAYEFMNPNAPRAANQPPLAVEKPVEPPTQDLAKR